MKSILEEYGLVIIESIVAFCVMGIFVFLLTKFSVLAEHFAKMLMGG